MICVIEDLLLVRKTKGKRKVSLERIIYSIEKKQIRCFEQKGL